MSSKEHETMMDVACGDVGLSRHLKNSLRVIRDKTGDEDFKKLADDIIAGKQSLREASQSDVFSRVLDPQVEAASTELASMSDEEREELARTGEKQLDALGEAPPTERNPELNDEEIDFSNTTWLS